MHFSHLLILLSPSLLLAHPSSSSPSLDTSTLDARQQAQVSPDGTCGAQPGGTYFCPFNEPGPCCSSAGFCGTGDAYCLTTLGCQAAYSPPGQMTRTCYAPVDKVTVSPDNTCGKTGAGEDGYRCSDANGLNCCSSYGYCGNTTAYCDVPEYGCQPDYGYCRRTGA